MGIPGGASEEWELSGSRAAWGFMCHAEDDMGHHKLQLVLLFQSEASIAINASCVILGC